MTSKRNAFYPNDELKNLCRAAACEVVDMLSIFFEFIHEILANNVRWKKYPHFSELICRIEDRSETHFIVGDPFSSFESLNPKSLHAEIEWISIHCLVKNFRV